MKNLDWANLSFGYRPTDYNVRCYYRDGKWGEIEICSDEYIKMHMAATCLHYGQEAFEGLKAYRCPDGKVRVFRMDENAKRLQSTCRGILMPEGCIADGVIARIGALARRTGVGHGYAA